MAHRLGVKKQYKARRYDKDIMLLQLKELGFKWASKKKMWYLKLRMSYKGGLILVGPFRRITN